MEKSKVKIVTMRCRECGGKWIPRVSAPKKCPHCQTQNWDGSVVYRPRAAAAHKAKPKK